MQELDPGHKYYLPSLNEEAGQILQFVKREGPGYPGNIGNYPGTTLQHVLRACRERIFYLQWQRWCIENVIILALVSFCIWLLEFRAARQHRTIYWKSVRFANVSPMCFICGHTTCEHRGE